MSDNNYFDIKVEGIYHSEVYDCKVAELSVSLVDSDNKYDLKVMLDNTGDFKDHILEVVNQVPELFEENGADGDVYAYTSLSHYLVKESEYQIKKELGLPEYQWTPEELGFNFFNKHTGQGVETIIDKRVNIPSLNHEYNLQFTMKDRYEFEVIDTTPELLSKVFGVDANDIKKEALESFEKDKAEVTIKLIGCEFRDKDGLSNDELYLKHIEMDTLPAISSLEVDSKHNVVKADVSSSFVIVDEYSGKNIKSDFSKAAKIEFPIVAVSGLYEIDYNSEKYKQDIKTYMDSFKRLGSFSYDIVNKIADKKENNDFALLSSIESKMVKDGIKPEASKQKKGKNPGMSM